MIEAAVTLIAERGYERTSLAEIALAAGYSHGQAARRFATKAALLGQVLDTLLTDWHEDVVEPGVASRAAQDGAAAVLSVIEGYIDLVRRRPTQVAAVQRLFLEGGLGDGELAVRVRELHVRLRHQMAAHVRVGVAAGGIRADVDPDAVASLMVSALRGAGYQWLLDPERFDLVAALRGLEQHLAAVLRPPTAGR